MLGLVYAVSSPMTQVYHATRSCAARGGAWPALRMSRRAAKARASDRVGSVSRP